MSLPELEKAVASLSPDDLGAFSQWFEEFLADAWDRQIEADAEAGRLDAALKQADDDYQTGRCTPL
jgi:hypothetical protein